MENWQYKQKHRIIMKAHGARTRLLNKRIFNRKKAIKELINSIKEEPCLDCGGNFPPCAMDFDHVKASKVGDISYVSRKFGLIKVIEEILKCELVCANCHRVRSNLRKS